MSSFVQDVRYALRALARAKAFTAVTLVTLGVGIGANATVFAFVSALLLRPAPGIAEPSSLVAIYTGDPAAGPYGLSSYPDYAALEAGTAAFSSMAAEQDDMTGIIRADGVVERVRISSVTAGYFGVLGVEARMGRMIGPADVAPSAPPVAVLGHALWMRAFASDPAMLGRALTVNGRAHTIVGIAPERFTGLYLGRATDLWLPLQAPLAMPQARGVRRLSIVARLRDAVSLDEARGQVSTVAARLAARYPETNRGMAGDPAAPRAMTVLPHTRLAPQFRGMVTTFGAILMTAVGLVLAIACANIATLLLSRATARNREMAVRLALGAAPSRVVRLVLTESLLLGLGGGTLGLLVSLWTADLLPSFFPEAQARMLDTAVDTRAILFVVGLSAVASVLFGLAPALHAAAPARSAALRAGSAHDPSGGSSRVRRTLVAAQVALAVILLVGASLLARSVVNGLTADPGFGARRVLLAWVELPDEEFTPEEGLLYYRAALERIRTLPEVESASVVRTPPTSRLLREHVRLDGYQPQGQERPEIHVNIAGDGYFEALQVPVLAGRAFEAVDRRGGAPVAVVNALLADRYFAGRAVGRRLTDASGAVREIVGVVRNTIDLDIQSPHVPVVYYPLAQRYDGRMTLLVRTAGDPLRHAGTLRRELLAVNRNVPVFRISSLSAHMAEASADMRLTATLVSACGVMALLLAATGVYGVIAFAVARRQREIAVRLALGARPRHVVRLVTREAITVTAAGLVAGLAGAALTARGLQSLLYGVTPSDPLTYALAPLVLALVAAAGALAPARRALSVEPNTVLRQD